jgi:hypothetical protein
VPEAIAAVVASALVVAVNEGATQVALHLIAISTLR